MERKSRHRHEVDRPPPREQRRAVALDSGRCDIDAEALRGGLDERRGLVSAELAREVRIVPEPQERGSDSIDEDRIRAPDRDVLGRRPALAEAVATHARGTLGEHDVRARDLQAVGHALREDVKAVEVRLLPSLLVLRKQLERVAQLLVHAPLLVEGG